MTTKITTPGGAPIPDLGALARAHTAEAVKVLATLTITGETAAVRALATNALRDRGVTVTYIDVTGAAS